MSWTHHGSSGLREIIHWPPDADLERLHKVRGGNPVLFPFSARTFHQGTIQKWQSPQGEILDMPMHGLARQADFEIVSQDQGHIRSRMIVSDEAKACYPYNYRFEVEYRFFEQALEVDFVLTNQDQNYLPWSAGHHFYFQLPWTPGTQKQQYSLHLEAQEALNHLEDGSLGNKELPSGPYVFDQSTEVDRIHTQLKSSLIEVRGPDNSSLRIWAHPSEPVPGDLAVVTWREHDDSPYECIEPWMGPPNGPEHLRGLRKVAPGCTDLFRVRLEIT